ncbi:hypothetical protein HDZ31DRAFT_36308, partial [Schizophyllum fasciatum]
LPPWAGPPARPDGYFDIPPTPAFQRGCPPVPGAYYTYDPNGASYPPRPMSWHGHRPRMPQMYSAASAPAQLPPWSTLSKPQPLPGDFGNHDSPYGPYMPLPPVFSTRNDAPGMFPPSTASDSDEPPPLARAHTYNSSSRAAHGRYASVPDFAVYDSSARSVRPADWRADFRPPRRRFGCRRLSLSNPLAPSPGTSRGRTTRGHKLHPLLQHHTRKHREPPIAYNLRDALAAPYLPQQHRFATDADLFQLALQPATHEPAYLFHPRLPWIVRVRPGSPTGLTIRDVFEGLCAALHRQIRVHHLYNEVLNGDDRDAVSAAYKARCKGDHELYAEGVKRIDFMGPEVIFCGLAKARNGLWEIKTMPIDEES